MRCPSTFQGHFGPKRFCASHRAWWSLLAGFHVHVRARVPRAPPGRAGKLSIIGLKMIQWGATRCWWILMDFEPRATDSTLDLIVLTVFGQTRSVQMTGAGCTAKAPYTEGVESGCLCKFFRLRWPLEKCHTCSFAPRAARTRLLDVKTTVLRC